MSHYQITAVGSRFGRLVTEYHTLLGRSRPHGTCSSTIALKWFPCLGLPDGCLSGSEQVRERAGGLYSTLSYITAVTIVEVPLLFTVVSVFAGVAYPMVGTSEANNR